MKRFLFAALALLSLAGCPMPQTVVRSVDTRPSIAVAGAPAGSVLWVDGKQVGPAPAYALPNTLLLEPGAHEVEIRDPAGGVIFRQRIFVESELKTIQVH